MYDALLTHPALPRNLNKIVGTGGNTAYYIQYAVVKSLVFSFVLKVHVGVLFF